METPAREILRFFRNIWGIRGRSRSLPTVKGTLRVVGRGIKLVAYFNEKGEPKTVVPLFRKDENGNDTVTLIGRWRAVERQRRVMAERHPEYQWHEMYREGLGAAEVKVDRLPAGDLTDPAIRRLAAKIAYERFAQLRATNVLRSADFEPLRDLVIRGQEGGQPICGLLYHPTIMEKFLPIPVPMHAVGLVAHRRSRVLGAFVVLFGLYYYWVILSRNCQILGPWDDQVLIHPQAGEVDVRMLRGTAQAPPVDWNQLIGLMTSSGRIVRDAEAHAVRKLTEAAAQCLPGS